ncbi:uncharacterized protein TRIVIDRAFT_39044 [Trichoderma virens Gv29-8]|uniref:Uncharacterized protein n=1 Tax=Hypocrea virens (strain Gv29-8 / FGSC 10586) TaxID=413071 RepID=G9NCG4_HYPVG|nr:uncharacterized protein TRIVIDRAFT_39044 [Trichoderma virens Gv29-8]EHK15388.1 hypothetical protein TRIVIDRAFT_39044 [Trichoderma virens Gv29-8]UKZ51329.1 hypothetical protein TrVGV298_005088 [Trichoderma virens]
MTDSRELEPPPQTHVEDPGAHQLAEASDSEDQFTDAQSAPTSPGVSSPVPKTRVEKVDNEPAYGEVPGTEAYKKREQDAEPDEIAMIPENDPESSPSTPLEPGTVPVTLVEESTGDYPGQHDPEEQEKHKADATPDIILSPNGELRSRSRRDSLASSQPTVLATQNQEADDEVAAEEEVDDFGDDFDDFEEGALTFLQSIPDFDGLSLDEVISAVEPCLPNLFPPEELDFQPFPHLSKDSSIFLTPRSASLWSQLVAPPPLAPPDWIRSRTRRLFLVSLGVPVDLDEILPASKQKKLVLPSLNIPSASPRGSSDLRSATRLKQGDGNASSTSIDSQGKPSTSKRRKGPPPQPELDLVVAKHLCQTTDEALDGMTDQELKQHVAKLEAMQGAAKDVLDYWTKRTDEKIGDREAFEGVIENLVAHARKVRK